MANLKTNTENSRQKDNSKQPRQIPAKLHQSIRTHVDSIYPEQSSDLFVDQIIENFWPQNQSPKRRGRTVNKSLWDETDSVVITYGNTFINGENKPLDLLYDFAETHLKGSFSGIHILPYFPYTSDDGFAITDYYEIDSGLGDWEDVQRISTNFRLMSDLVINHCSSQSKMFNNYLLGYAPFDRFFYETSPDEDLSQVVRPRAHPLLRLVEKSDGSEKYVWCTFSHDQVDFDFSNPEVLFEFLRILRFHIANGVRTIRLDAVAFLWKEVGTSCIHLPQTHEIIRLLRLLVDFNDEPIILITETNVPNTENLSYFGNRNEAHAVYNFSLPPLLLHALLHGTSSHLNAWQMSMPPAQMGCAYFNFTASHDGIGLRPAEGLLSDDEINSIIDLAKEFGGLVSMREMADGSLKPYEINIALFDALKGTAKGEDELNVQRFLCSQIIAMGLEGIPGFYIHSLLATPNDYKGVQKAQHNRAINRHRWHYPDLLERLSDKDSTQSIILSKLKALMRLRAKQAAFHPNATQFTLQLGDELFGFWRQSMDRAQSIFAIHNLTDRKVSIPVMSLNLIGGDEWRDLLSGEAIDPSIQDLEFEPYQCRWVSNNRLAKSA